MLTYDVRKVAEKIADQTSYGDRGKCNLGISTDIPPCITQFAEDFSERLHYENTPMQYTDFFVCKNKKKKKTLEKKLMFFLIFPQNIDCGYTLELPHRGGSNEYPQSMFWGKNKKKRYTPAYPSFAT